MPNVVFAKVGRMFQVNWFASQANNLIRFSALVIENFIKLIKTHQCIVVNERNILTLPTEIIEELIAKKGFNRQIVVCV